MADTKAKRFAGLLRELGACSEARQWAEGKTLAEVWQTCERGDWMFWLAARLIGRHKGVTRQRLVLAACACAETSLHFVPAGEERPRIAIETARRWAKGDPAVTLGDVRNAACDAAAFAAYSASASAHAASASAAYAAAYAASDAAYDAACDAAYDAAYSACAAYSAAYSAYSARTAALRVCADIVRQHFRVRIEVRRG